MSKTRKAADQDDLARITEIEFFVIDRILSYISRRRLLLCRYVGGENV